MRCAFYCAAERYDLKPLANFLNEEGFEPRLYGDVIYIGEGLRSLPDPMFIFSYGSVVFWNFTSEDEHALLATIQPYRIQPVSDHHDTCTFSYNKETLVDEENDNILLESQDVLIKLSLSHGLAQSVKLQAFEAAVDRTIDNSRYLTQELAIRGRTSLSRRQLSQEIGSLFAQKNSVNLHCDILDTPEFFWKRPRYEPYYHMASAYMDISKRLDILNKRLEVMHDLYDILSNELKHSHSARLEWIIIFLIVLEVILHAYDFVKGM